MSRKKLIAGGIILLALVTAFASLTSGPSTLAPEQDSIGVITVAGTIMGGQQSVFNAVAGSEDIMAQIRQAAEDPSVKAVVLRVNSPGGGVAATQEITRELEKLQKKGKPLVVSMGDTAASGGYWVSAAADKIFANRGTLTGSIGVIMTLQNLEELYEKIGIDFDVYKSGPYKDIGSSSREATPEESEILQTMVDEIFAEFVNVVAEGRNLPREQVEQLATGRVFTGQQALEAGLVDEIGNYYDALQEAGKMAGIKGEPKIKTFGKKRVWESFLDGRLEGLWFSQRLLQEGNEAVPITVGPMLLAVPGDIQ